MFYVTWLVVYFTDRSLNSQKRVISSGVSGVSGDHFKEHYKFL